MLAERASQGCTIRQHAVVVVCPNVLEMFCLPLLIGHNGVNPYKFLFWGLAALTPLELNPIFIY